MQSILNYAPLIQAGFASFYLPAEVKHEVVQGVLLRDELPELLNVLDRVEVLELVFVDDAPGSEVEMQLPQREAALRERVQREVDHVLRDRTLRVRHLVPELEEVDDEHLERTAGRYGLHQALHVSVVEFLRRELVDSLQIDLDSLQRCAVAPDHLAEEP